jgi:hypothetical protein
MPEATEEAIPALREQIRRAGRAARPLATNRR